MTHSPKPWKVEQREHSGTYDDYTAVVDAAGDEVAGVGNENYFDGSYVDFTEEDAKHIVACVNFCRELPDELMEGVHLKPQIAVGGEVAEAEESLGIVKTIREDVK